MAIRPIHTVPDPVLRQKAKRVKTIDKSILKLIADMKETLSAANGVGLAAPQVGVSLRVIVVSIQHEDKEKEEHCLINPEVIRRTGERTVNEGCLSIPGYVGEIVRSMQVRVKGMDETGKQVKIVAEDLLGEALEHEIDHINGILYVDHLESQDKLHKLEPETKQQTAP
ncbi:MAG: peptide deformylase [Chloroflexi bacterium RBG_13_46_9]|nr:MAG: peptide deformylase [Chloroflexi bacterium RBG_13_46_9]